MCVCACVCVRACVHLCMCACVFVSFDEISTNFVSVHVGLCFFSTCASSCCAYYAISPDLHSGLVQYEPASSICCTI